MTAIPTSRKPRRAKPAMDLELQQYRDLLPPPDHWEDGFGVKAMIGGVFVGMVMTPASMYLQLVQGGDIGSAATWVTIILFIEVARRAFTTLKRPEIYILYYMAGATLVSGSGLLQSQFLVQSDSFRKLGITSYIPSWFAPSSPDVLGTRSFFRREWLVPIGLLAIAQAIQRLDHFGLGYVMYRLTSDVEKLPFPMAPVAAQGITALSDASSGEETWRWRLFSFGAMLGMAFGAIYIALPAVSGALLPEPISILPLPFKDLTLNTQYFLPATPMMITFDLGAVLLGMVLPYWAMVGSFLGLIALIIANPILYHYGILHTWKMGGGGISTITTNYMDFYLSWGLGLAAAIAFIGFWHVGRSLMRRKREAADLGIDHSSNIDWSRLFNPPEGRGDFSLWIALGIYVFSTLSTIVTAYWLLTWAHHENPANSAVSPFLIMVLFFYGFVYTPILSYVSARMQGLIGQGVTIPFAREATLMLTGYKGAAIWFAPFPIYNYGDQTQYFRVTELTGTKISSMVKAEFFIFPIVLVATIVYSQFIWRIAAVPSSAFPYAQQFWELNAFRTGIIYTATLPGQEHGAFFQAFNVHYLAAGFGVATVAYYLLSAFGLPILLVYGMIRGLDGSAPMAIIPQFIGALIGRFYFEKKIGAKWKDYIIVFVAGYGCGVGLVTMFSLGLVFMSKSVFQSTF